VKINYNNCHEKTHSHFRRTAYDSKNNTMKTTYQYLHTIKLYTIIFLLHCCCLQGCRKMELEYRKWPIHDINEYPEFHGIPGECRIPFDWRMFYDEDIKQIITAKGGRFKVQYNPETENISYGPYFYFASARNNNRCPWMEEPKKNGSTHFVLAM